MDSINDFLVLEEETIIKALNQIDRNKKGFLIVINKDRELLAVITDGDIRRYFISGGSVNGVVSDSCTYNPRFIGKDDGLNEAITMFKDEAIHFLPIVDQEKRVVSVLTKKQLHVLLLGDIHDDDHIDYFSIDENVIDYEIYPKPWGFYKTTVLNDFYQSKVLNIVPGGRISLQVHEHREEYWTIVHGNGLVEIGKSKKSVSVGSTVFIPKDTPHRVTNVDDTENLIITEIQIGEYLGEDDIIRIEDDYERCKG